MNEQTKEQKKGVRDSGHQAWAGVIDTVSNTSRRLETSSVKLLLYEDPTRRAQPKKCSKCAERVFADEIRNTLTKNQIFKVVIWRYDII